MKKVFIFAFVMVFTLTAAGCAVGNRLAVAESPAVSDDSAMLKANEKKAWETATKAFSAERQPNCSAIQSALRQGYGRTGTGIFG